MKTTMARSAALRQILTERRHDLQNDIQRRLRSGRAEQRSAGRDDLERSDDESRVDLDLVLLQMRAETLGLIDEALHRLDAGEYGVCIECHAEIGAPRLRALPFAVRCRACEGEREATRDRAGHHRPTPDAPSPFMGGSGS